MADTGAEDAPSDNDARPCKRQKVTSSTSSSDLSDWYRLTSDLFGQIARFLRVTDGHLHNFLSCVGRTCGPNTLNIIRRIYLTKNMNYAWHCWQMMTAYLAYDAGIDVKEAFTKWKHNLYIWMDLNETLWKERARGAQVPSNVLTISLKPHEEKEDAHDPTKLWWDNFLINMNFSRHDGHTAISGDSLGLNEQDFLAVSNFTKQKVVVTAVDDKEFVPYGGVVLTEIESIRERMRLGEQITVRLRREEDLMFSYLPLVIELGLDRVLRYLIEENGVDQNCLIKFEERNPLRRFEESLIFCAARSRDPACAKYLLSVVDKIPDHSRFLTLLRYAAYYSESIGTFKAILEQPYVRTHQVNPDHIGFSPLLDLCDPKKYVRRPDGRFFRMNILAVEKVAALLDAGADPTYPIRYAKRNLEHLDMEKAISDPTYYTTKEDDCWIKVVSMMEDAMPEKQKS